MIAEQAGAKIYNELAFKSQYFNEKGGIRYGNVWIHCGNSNEHDLIQIGDSKENGMYPGMLYKNYLKSKFT